MAMTFARFEVMGYQIRVENGVLAIGVNGLVYSNAKDLSKSWRVIYSGNDSTIYSKIKEAFISGTITGNQIGNYEKWIEWLTKKEIDFELATTEEDLERLRKENYNEWPRITSLLHK